MFYDTGYDRVECRGVEFHFFTGVDLHGYEFDHPGSVRFEAQDSAPAHSVGRTVLASPTWDPDGDGNGEIVCSDGTAWNEVVDLPNYT